MGENKQKKNGFIRQEEQEHQNYPHNFGQSIVCQFGRLTVYTLN